jgi:hypothetical protein
LIGGYPLGEESFYNSLISGDDSVVSSACNIACGNMHSNKMLAGKTQELTEFQFGVRDMGRIIDLMEDLLKKCNRR